MVDSKKVLSCTSFVLLFISFATLLCQYLTVYFAFDKDNFDTDFYIYTLYFFLLIRMMIPLLEYCISNTVRSIWIQHFLMIIIEITQAFIMIIFVGGFGKTITTIQINSTLLFFIITLIQIAFEIVSAFKEIAISNEDFDQNINFASGKEIDKLKIARLRFVVIIGCYAIPVLYFKTNRIENELNSVGMYLLYTIGIVCFGFSDVFVNKYDDEFNSNCTGTVTLFGNVPIGFWCISVVINCLEDVEYANDIERVFIIIMIIPIISCCCYAGFQSKKNSNGNPN